MRIYLAITVLLLSTTPIFPQQTTGGVSTMGGVGTTGFGTPPANCGAYAKCYAIMTDYTKFPNTDQTNFVLPIRGTAATASTGSGGYATNANGYDVIFASNVNCTTKMNWDTDTYSSTSTNSVWHLRVPTISHTANTLVGYLCVGNSAVTTDQSTASATWSGIVNNVYHFGNGTTLSSVESAGSGNSVTFVGSPTAVTGLLSGGVNFSSATGKYATFTGCPTTTARTILFAFKETTTVTSTAVAYDQWNGTSGNRALLYLDGGVGERFTTTGGYISVSGNWADGNQHVVAYTYDGTNVIVYDNAANVGSGALNLTTDAPGLLNTNGDSGSVGTYGYIATYDEFRCYSSALSADTITATTNALNAAPYTLVAQ